MESLRYDTFCDREIQCHHTTMPHSHAQYGPDWFICSALRYFDSLENSWDDYTAIQHEPSPRRYRAYSTSPILPEWNPSWGPSPHDTRATPTQHRLTESRVGKRKRPDDSDSITGSAQASSDKSVKRSRRNERNEMESHWDRLLLSQTPIAPDDLELPQIDLGETYERFDLPPIRSLLKRCRDESDTTSVGSADHYMQRTKRLRAASPAESLRRPTPPVFVAQAIGRTGTVILARRSIGPDETPPLTSLEVARAIERCPTEKLDHSKAASSVRAALTSLAVARALNRPETPCTSRPPSRSTKGASRSPKCVKRSPTNAKRSSSAPATTERTAISPASTEITQTPPASADLQSPAKQRRILQRIFKDLHAPETVVIHQPLPTRPANFARMENLAQIMEAEAERRCAEAERRRELHTVNDQSEKLCTQIRKRAEHWDDPVLRDRALATKCRYCDGADGGSIGDLLSVLR